MPGIIEIPKDLFDLAGWHVETWWQMIISGDDKGGDRSVIGYTTDRNNALSGVRGRSYCGGDGDVREVLVLAKCGGGTGYLLSDVPIMTEVGKAHMAEVRATTIASLSDEQLAALGLSRDK